MRMLCIFSILFFSVNCGSATIKSNENTIDSDFPDSPIEKRETIVPTEKNDKDTNVIITKASHHLNTSADEYLPIMDIKNNRIYFTGMDRTGYFDFKIDFTKVKSSGGEDIFYCDINNGVLSDAKPLSFLNTNSHESVTDVKQNGDLILTGNYPENLGPPNDNDNGSQTTDIFLAKKGQGKFQIIHLPEPVNSIFNEFDAVSDEGFNYILYSSDRAGHVGKYHKKGWLWENSRWGNTDIYVSIKDGDEWQKPINLGKKVNTPNAERSPWLSKDGLTLYIASNGFENHSNMNIYFFKRKDKNDWINWEGPYPMKNINTENDEWGYKIYDNQISTFSRCTPFDYPITQRGRSGDAGIRESNFRSGYELYGAQSAALKKEMNTDVYLVHPKNVPQINLGDILFQFNKFDLKPEFNKIALSIADFCKQNPEKSILIIGHTDNIGDENYNIKLSNERAKSVKNALTNIGVKNRIDFQGVGSKQPAFSNTNDQNRKKNRRVEIFFK